MDTLRNKIEQVIAAKSMLAHSFYARWQHGELSKEELQGYAKEYYAFESNFPRFVSAIHSRCEDGKTRQVLLENLNHEEHGEENHPELWLRFTEGLGLDREDVKAHRPSEKTVRLIQAFQKHCQSDNVIDGIAALYAYERQQPSVATTKIEGLKEFYGLTDERSLSFFKAHAFYDVGHSASEMALLDKLCLDEESRRRAERVIEDTLGALYGFLDGVESNYRKAA